MGEPPAIAAAKHVIEIVLEKPRPSDQELTRALDRLLTAYHEIPEDQIRCLTDIDAPDINYRILYEAIGTRFDGFGYYAVASFRESVEEQVMLADSIDDLGDIVKDLQTAIWYFENCSVEDAYWYLNLLYSHWSRHLRELTLYLHTRQFG